MGDIRDWRKSRMINIKISEKEFILLKAKAARFTDGNVSEYLRACAFGKKPKKPHEIDEYIDEEDDFYDED